MRADTLPGPSNYALRRSTGVFETRQDLRRMHLTDRPDAYNDPTVLLLTWQNVRPEVAQAIQEHYETFGMTTFQLALTGLEDVPADNLHVRWLTPPVINWNSPVSASVTGELETVLAFTPPSI